METFPAVLSVSGDTVVVDLWGPTSEEELRGVASALADMVRARTRSGSTRVSKVETKLRTLVEEAMTDAGTLRIDCPEWTVSLVASRLVAVGAEDGIPTFAIVSESSVRVTLR